MRSGDRWPAGRSSSHRLATASRPAIGRAGRTGGRRPSPGGRRPPGRCPPGRRSGGPARRSPARSGGGTGWSASPARSRWPPAGVARRRGRPAPPATPAASGPRSTSDRDGRRSRRPAAGRPVAPGPWAPPGPGPRRRPRPHHLGRGAGLGGSGSGRPARRRQATTPGWPRLDPHQSCPWWCDSRA
jgi:hypothetical protein